MKLPTIPIVFCLATCLGAAAVGVAAPVAAAAHDPSPVVMYRDAGGISADQAAAIVRGSFGGRVVSVRAAGKNGWDVRVILDGGRVKTVRVDGNGSIRSSD